MSSTSVDITLENNLNYNSIFYTSTNGSSITSGTWDPGCPPSTITYDDTDYAEAYNNAGNISLVLKYYMTSGGQNDWISVSITVNGTSNTCNTTQGSGALQCSQSGFSSTGYNPSVTISVGDKNGYYYAVKSPNPSRPNPKPISVGQGFPNVLVTTLDEHRGKYRKVHTHRLFSGKRYVLFSITGAFDPKCKALPSFVSAFDNLKDKGIEKVYMTSVNDADVLKVFENHHKCSDKIVMIADAGGYLAQALGLIDSSRRLDHGLRGHRFAAVIFDNRIEYLGVDDNPWGSSTTATATGTTTTSTTTTGTNASASTPEAVLAFLKSAQKS